MTASSNPDARDEGQGGQEGLKDVEPQKRPRHRIEIARPALKELRALPRPVQKRITPHIDALAINPRPRGSRKLSGTDGQYRIRVGDYRVIYAIQDDVLLVLVVRIANRRDAYRP